ncbi:helix-turn-helix transcriptional regulator [Campylobacter coli]|uniref:helix-turn-helix transcriptional regulator n=1 Tax=Campylobacter coli TaxID=195 RepID=UPI00093130E3|nr:helix-turn-helix transcriptional regulator [Campylobacter coli]ECL1007815.1 helix-turn-helix transcriptional regulator [Campylobacter coli]
MQKFLTIISAINDESRVLILYHLLKDAGFLYVKRKGTWAYYGINNELLKLHSDLFENIKNLDIDNIVLEQNTCENDK